MDRGAAVRDVALAAVAGYQDGVVGQSLDSALSQCLHYRDGGRHAAFLVEYVEDFGYRPAEGLGEGPAGQLFSDGIQACYPRFGIRGYYGISYGVERDRKIFLAFAQGEVCLLQQSILRRLEIEQMLRFQLYGVPKAEPHVPGSRENEHQGKQKDENAGENEDNKQSADAGSELLFALYEHILFYRRKGAHFRADRIHDSFSVSANHECKGCRGMVVAVQLDNG